MSALLRPLRLLLLATLPLAACSTSYEARVELAGTELGAASDLLARTRNGSVVVEVDPARRDVAVEARVRAGGASQADARMRAEAVRIEPRVVGDRLEIVPEWPDAPRSDDAVSLRVVVPTLRDAELSTSNGAIQIAGAAGAARLDTSNGSVVAREIGGGVAVRTSNGTVRVEGAGGEVSVRTSNGSVRIDGAPGPLAVSTSNGGIELVDVGGPLDVSTSNGAVRAILRPGFAGTLEARTSNGGVTVASDASVVRSRMERQQALIEFATAGGASRIVSSNGSIRIGVGGAAP